MRIVKVPEQLFRKNASYERLLVIRGHVAGTLSGVYIGNGAAMWRGKYSKTRAKVNKLLASYGIAKEGAVTRLRADGTPKHSGMVWLHPTTNEPIQLVFYQFTDAEMLALKTKKKLLGGK